MLKTIKSLGAQNIFFQLVVGACIGVTVGVGIEMFISIAIVGKAIFGEGQFLSQFARLEYALLVERLVYALLGALSALWATIAYASDDKLSEGRNTSRMLVKQSAVHVIGQALLVFLTGLYLKWFDLGNMSGLLVMLFIFIIVYLLIWLMCYAKIAHDVKQLNATLDKMQKTGNSQRID